MRYLRTLSAAMALSLACASLTAAPILAQDKGGGDDQHLMSLAVWDHPGRQAEQAALDLVALAPELSGGAITVEEPVWGAADAAELVRSGQVDLAILATREWSPLGVTSLDALEAPFLIDTDALAAAVATSDVADMAMSGLEDLGVTGLAMWPEDLRHVFGFGPFDRAFSRPGDFEGSTILGISGDYGRELITTLGGRLYEEFVENDDQTGDRVLDSQSGALDGMVTGLWGAGLATDQISQAFVAGDVVLFPKFQLLVANADSLERLSQEQRVAFDAIVSEVHRLALDRQLVEAELAAGICELGGTVTEAGPEAREALRAAAKPLLDRMVADPVMGDIIGRVGQLTEETPADPGAGTCVAAVTDQPESVASAGAEAVSEADLAGYLGTELPPSGTYRAEMVGAEMEAAGADAHYAAINDGIWTWTFADDSWQAVHDRNTERCSGSIETVDGNVRFLTVVSQGCGMDYDVRWRQEGADLALRLADLPWTYTAGDFGNEQVFIDRLWTRIDSSTNEPADALPLVGTYRAEIPVEDLESEGVDHDVAVQNGGIVTLTLLDGQGALEWESGVTAGYVCPFTISSAGEVVQLTFEGGDCDPGVYEMAVTVEGDAILPEVISTIPPGDLSVVQAFFDRSWTRID